MADIKQISLAGTTYNLVDDSAVHSVSVNASQSSGTQIGTVTVDGTTTTLYAPSASDTKVQQNAAITTAGSYPIMLGYNTNTTAVTNTLNKAALFTYNPSTKLLFTGAIGVTENTGWTDTVPSTTTGYTSGQIMFVVFNDED